jgi:outer membrane lipoprotein carrier protein LolA
VKAGLLACALGLAAVALLGAAPVARIQSILARSKVLCGRFDQSKQLVGLKKPVTSNGRFCVVVDKGVLWRSLQPFPTTLKLTRDQIIQMQGERVTLRLDAEREPAVQMIHNVLFALLAGDLAPLEKLFVIEGDVQEKSWSVTLKAREPGLAKAIGGIALEGGGFVKSITISEANGDLTHIVFSAIQTGDGAMTADEAALF